MATREPQDICERTFEFALCITRACRQLQKLSDVDRILCRQLLRAGTSIGANVEEAQAGQSRADFVAKYCIALKEAREAHYWLRLLLADHPNCEALLDPLRNEASQLVRIIAAIIIKAKGN